MIDIGFVVAIGLLVFEGEKASTWLGFETMVFVYSKAFLDAVFLARIIGRKVDELSSLNSNSISIYSGIYISFWTGLYAIGKMAIVTMCLSPSRYPSETNSA